MYLKKNTLPRISLTSTIDEWRDIPEQYRVYLDEYEEAKLNRFVKHQEGEIRLLKRLIRIKSSIPIGLEVPFDRLVSLMRSRGLFVAPIINRYCDLLGRAVRHGRVALLNRLMKSMVGKHPYRRMDRMVRNFR